MNLTFVNTFPLCVMAGKEKYYLLYLYLKGICPNHELPSKKACKAFFWILTLVLYRSITGGAKISGSYWERILGPHRLFLYQVAALKQPVGILYAFRFVFLRRRESMTTAFWFQQRRVILKANHLEQKAEELPLEKNTKGRQEVSLAIVELCLF